MTFLDGPNNRSTDYWYDRNNGWRRFCNYHAANPAFNATMRRKQFPAGTQFKFLEMLSYPATTRVMKGDIGKEYVQTGGVIAHREGWRCWFSWDRQAEVNEVNLSI